MQSIMSATQTTSKSVQQISETEASNIDQESISARTFIELTLYAIVEDVVKSHRVRSENEPCAYADLHECVTSANSVQIARVGSTTPSQPDAPRVRSRARSAAPADQPAITRAAPAPAIQSIAADAFMEVTPLLGGELYLCEAATGIFLLEGRTAAPTGTPPAVMAADRPPATACVGGAGRLAGGAPGPLTPAQRSWAATVGARPLAPGRDGRGARFRFDVAEVMGPNGPLAG